METLNLETSIFISSLSKFNEEKPIEFTRSELVDYLKNNGVQYYMIIPSALIKYGIIDRSGNFKKLYRNRVPYFKFSGKPYNNGFLKKHYDEIRNWSTLNRKRHFINKGKPSVDEIHFQQLKLNYDKGGRISRRDYIKSIDVSINVYNKLNELSETNKMTKRSVLEQLVNFGYPEFSTNTSKSEIVENKVIDQVYDIRNMSLKSIIDFARAKEPNAKITAIVTVTTQTEL